MTITDEKMALPSAESLLDAMSEAVYVVDRQRRIMFWNPAAEALTGFSAEEVVGRRCRDGVLNHVDDEGNLLCRTGCPLQATMRDGAPREAAVFLHHRDGHRVPVSVRSAALRDDAGVVVGAVEVFHDDSLCRGLVARLDDAEHQVLTDPLTGLGNRRHLDQCLHRYHDEFTRYHRRFAVLFCDVDEFKFVNDTYGHDVGDKVLKVVAETLRSCTRPSDSVGRFGGEEFMLLAPVLSDAQAVALADRVRAIVRSSWTLAARRRISVTLSVGVAVVGPGETARRVVKRADDAMLAAKAAGRDRTELA